MLIPLLWSWESSRRTPRGKWPIWQRNNYLHVLYSSSEPETNKKKKGREKFIDSIIVLSKQCIKKEDWKGLCYDASIISYYSKIPQLYLWHVNFEFIGKELCKFCNIEFQRFINTKRHIKSYYSILDFTYVQNVKRQHKKYSPRPRLGPQNLRTYCMTINYGFHGSYSNSGK